MSARIHAPTGNQKRLIDLDKMQLCAITLTDNKTGYGMSGPI